MSVHVGIDAGGTYTDAVIYQEPERQVLDRAKAQTTRENLSIGIDAVLDKLDAGLLRQTDSVCLSTTLATNACVEEKGGNGRLVLLNVDQRTIDWVGGTYGLPSSEDMKLVEDSGDAAMQAFIAGNIEWLREASGIALVDKDAVFNQAAAEKRWRDALEQACGVPVICGHELYNELNSLRRGASTLLNVRLIPIIAGFLQATRHSLAGRGIHAPVSIVRSDGSLMSENYTRVRPVETLLCGPAAGLIGVAHITGEADCMVVDMGGTTTDVSLVRGHRPQMEESGINIGRWRTFAKGVFVDTYGLGGDSTIHVEHGKPVLLPRRSVPLCMAAARWPVVKEKLRALLEEKPFHTRPLHECWALAGSAKGRAGLTSQERRFLQGLQQGPLITSEAAQLWGTDVYNFNPARLEDEGLVVRYGVTPTDMMHLKGDFTEYDAEASALGAAFLAACAQRSPQAFADDIYDAVKRRLYTGIVRVMLQQQHKTLQKDGLSPALELVIDQAWDDSRQAQPGRMPAAFRLPFPLVGIGAPTHIFLPDVAQALSTHCIIPQDAHVANAVGAAVGRIEVVYRLEVREKNNDEGACYEVEGPYETYTSEEKEDALENAMAQARRAAGEEAGRRGLQGALQYKTRVLHRECQTAYGSGLYLGSVVEALAYSG